MAVSNKIDSMTKRGVALITVLLIMMVATIATTAIYKWISHMGESSAAELKKSEAYQASQAGLETARSWLEHNADDAGALLTQYFQNKNSDGRPKSLLMDGVLQNIASSDNVKKFSVYLVGADVQSYPYKLKIVSTGFSRDGSKYSQMAMLNVNGLYQAVIPSKEKVADFHEGFFGGADDQISFDVNSAIINGDASFNTMVNVDSYLVVTGTLNVNSNTTIRDLFVKGSLKSCTGLHVTKDTYIEDKLYANGNNTFDGDLYVKNGIDITGSDKAGFFCGTGAGGSLTVGNNLSTEGDVELPRHKAAYPIIVGGNTVIRDNKKFRFPHANGDDFTNQIYMMYLNGNVFVPGGFNDGSHARYTVSEKIRIGTAGTKVFLPGLHRISTADGMLDPNYSKWTEWGISTVEPNKVKALNMYSYHAWGGVYVRNYTTLGEGLPGNTYCNKSDCAPTSNEGAIFAKNAEIYGGVMIGMWGMPFYNIYRDEIFVQVNGDYLTAIPDTSGWGANMMADYADRITTENTGEGCGTGSHIEDPLQFNKNLLTSSAYMHSNASNKHCNASLWQSWSNNWHQMSDCYETAKEHGELYGGEWLLLKFTNPQWSDAGSAILDGKFIIIIDGEGTQKIALPKMTESSMAIIYFPSGYNGIISTDANTEGSGYPSNYFLYSEDDLKNLQMHDRTLNGTIYLTDCHRAGATQTMKIRFNEELVAALSRANIICKNDNNHGGCSTTVTSSSSSAGEPEDPTDYGGTDPYFVATSPRLKVKLESEYKNEEFRITDATPSADTIQKVDSSVIVMPRLIYLPKDMDLGTLKLANFYQARVLNDPTKRTISGTTQCDAGVPSSTVLGTLSRGIYRCKFIPSSTNLKWNYFYVVVGEYGDAIIEEMSSSSGSSSSSVSVVSSSSTTPYSSYVYSSSEPQIEATCYFMPNNYTTSGADVTFYVDNIKNAASVPSATLKKTSPSVEDVGTYTDVVDQTSISFSAPTSPGTYVYTLYKNDSRALCSATLVTANTISCSVNKYEIDLGESVSFSGSYGGSCTSATFDNQSVQCANTIYRTVTPETAGTHSYTWDVTGTPNASCNQTVTVTAPSITCPSDVASAYGAFMTILAPSYSGCSNGCFYSLTRRKIGEGATGDTVVAYGSGVVNGEHIRATFQGQAAETQLAEETYTFRLVNMYGNSATPCSFEVTYSASVCTQEDKTMVSNDNQTISKTGGYSDGCFDFYTGKTCSNVQIKSNCGNENIQINGALITLNNDGFWSGAINPQETINISNVPSTCAISSIYVSNCTGEVDVSNLVSASCKFSNFPQGITTEATSVTASYPYMKLDVTNIVGPGNLWSQSFNLNLDGSNVGTISANIGTESQPYSTNMYNIVAPATLGSHVYTVEYNGHELCRKTINVVNALKCEVSTATPAADTQFTYSVSKAVDGLNCWSCNFANAGSSEYFDLDKTWTIDATGQTQKLSVSCTCENAPASCTNFVNFTPSAPDLTCPETVAQQKGGLVKLAPTSIVGCDTGCAYSIYDYTNARDIVSHTTKNYTGGQMEGFAAPDMTGQRTYRVTVENEYSGTNTDQCDIVVDYVSWASLGTVAGNDQAKQLNVTLTAGTTYTLTLEHRNYATKLRIAHWSGNPITLTYSDCSGTDHTETFNAWNQWYERDIGLNASDNCTITVTSLNGGDVSFHHW